MFKGTPKKTQSYHVQFQELARQLVITSCHVESPMAILNAVDADNTPYIDVLIQCDQKMVIAQCVL